MEILIPFNEVNVWDANNDKHYNINSEAPQEHEDDVYVAVNEKSLLDAIRETIANGEVYDSFVKKIVSALLENEAAANIIIKKGLEEAVKRSEGSCNAVMKAAKAIWKECSDDYSYDW